MSTPGHKAPGDNHAGRQKIVDVRKVLGEEASGSNDVLELTPEDVRLILHIRAIGYGRIDLTIVNKKPAKALRIEESVDYSKTISFLP